MTDPITGCPERALEPPERADQDRLDRLYDMYEAEASIELYLEGYKRLFPQCFAPLSGELEYLRA